MPHLATDLPTFRIIYPEFSTLDDSVVQFFIDDANEELSESAWGLCYPKAVLAFAAHNLNLSQGRQASTVPDDNGFVEAASTGAIASSSAAGLSVSFTQSKAASDSVDGNWYSQTPYGQHFLVLKRRCLSLGTLL